jgi:hypothetical protein
LWQNIPRFRCNIAIVHIHCQYWDQKSKLSITLSSHMNKSSKWQLFPQNFPVLLFCHTSHIGVCVYNNENFSNKAVLNAWHDRNSIRHNVKNFLRRSSYLHSKLPILKKVPFSTLFSCKEINSKILSQANLNYDQE